ncbi:MAG: nickel-dependent lactate racemase [Thermoleophilia bacterium]|nr:nickel-dependent lactate racemase [Thermoleophilia bacterium]
MMGELTLPWGRETLTVPVPSTWSLTVLTPTPRAAVDDVPQAVRDSLRAPIGVPRLAELAGAATRIALVVDDGSRPTPAAEMMPAVIAELDDTGARRTRMTIVTALGLHRPMSEAELRQRLGSGALEGVRWENHDCDDPSRLVELGATSRGTPVVMNRTVAEADLVVGIGCIEPHLIAGFGGGAKILVPGVAGRATIGRNHALHTTPETFDGVGRDPEQSPMRLDLEEAAAMLRPPVFVVDAVLNGELDVVRIVSGDPVAAHREGVRTSREIFEVALAAPADVVITDSHPMDQDLRQGMKAVGNAIRAVRKGGVLVALIRGEEGVGEVGLAGRRQRLGRRGLKLLSPLLVRLVPRMKLGGTGEEDRFFLYFALQAMRRATLLLYAPTVPAAVRDGLPFAEFVDSPEAAIARARSLVGESARVVAFPDGGATYPELGR